MKGTWRNLRRIKNQTQKILEDPKVKVITPTKEFVPPLPFPHRPKKHNFENNSRNSLRYPRNYNQYTIFKCTCTNAQLCYIYEGDSHK